VVRSVAFRAFYVGLQAFWTVLNSSRLALLSQLEERHDKLVRRCRVQASFHNFGYFFADEKKQAEGRCAAPEFHRFMHIVRNGSFKSMRWRSLARFACKDVLYRKHSAQFDSWLQRVMCDQNLSAEQVRYSPSRSRGDSSSSNLFRHNCLE